MKQYLAGSVIQTTQLLTNIRTYVAGALVYDYRLGYQQGRSGRNRLANLTLCQSDESTCLPPTNFTWDDGGDGTFSLGGGSYGGWNFGSPPANAYSAVTGDFNGDGRTDTLMLGSTSYALMTGNSDGTFTNHGATYTYNWNFGGPPNNGYTIVTGDFLGNGRTDVMLIGDASYYLMLGNADGSFTQSSASMGGWHFGSPPSANWTVVTGDFNGNGRTDIMFLGSTVYNLLTSNGDGTFTPSGASYPAGWNFGGNPSSTWSVQTGDFNGDGKTDIILLGNTSYCLLTSNGDGTFAPGGASYGGWGFGAPPWTSYTVLTGDFNGDGNTDVVLLGSSTYQLMTSKGDGTFVNAEATYNGWGFGTPPSANYTFQAGDFDGNGRTGVMFLGATGGGIMRFHDDGSFAGTGVSYGWNFGTPQSALYSVVSGDFNGDGKTDVMVLGASTDALLMTQGGRPDLMTGITTGLGAQTNIAYAPLDKYWLYTKGSSASYPAMDYTGALYVTESVNQSDGLGGLRQTAYLYSGAQMDLHGRGFLGFAGISTLDGPTQLFTEQNYNQAFPWTGTAGLKTTYLWKGSFSASPILAQSYTGYVACAMPGARFAVVPNVVMTSGNDLDGTVLPSTTTNYGYDFTDSTGGTCVGTTAYGDVTQIRNTSSEGFVKTTTSNYGDIVDGSHWLLGRATQVVQTNSGPGQTTLTHTTTAAYDGSGRVTQQIVEPTSAMWLKTSYSYDSYGNPLSVSALGWDNTTRQTTAAYDAQGRFATSVTDGLGHRTSLQHDSRFGGVTGTTDPNNLTSTSAYDGFGRKTLDTAADGAKTTYAYAYISGGSGGYSTSALSTDASGTVQLAPESYAYHDILDRLWATEHQTFDGTGTTRTRVVFDALGNVAQRSRPFLCCGPRVYTTYTYDVLGRVTQAVEPDGTTSTHAYHGEVTVDRNANSQTLTTTRNAEGQIIAVQDALGNTTRYAWDTFNHMIATIDPANNSVGMTYDLRGRMVQKQDPDVGTWSYTYDAFSQLVQTVDNKGQSTSVAYDPLGRMTQRTEPDLTSTWSYDTTNGIGKLAGAATNQGYTMGLTYDTIGRPTQSNMVFGGLSQTFSIGYDSSSRITSIQGPSTFARTRSYNAYGYLTGESESDTVVGPLWNINQMDVEGRVTQETFGNGITATRTYNAQNGELQSIATGPSNSVQSLSYNYDPIGNVLSRTDATQGLVETFGYDALNRLTSAQIGSNAAVTYGYDAIGNIKTKSDVGTYSYGPSGGAAPHRVQSIAGSLNTSFGYDANGNQTSGAGRTITWTSFNMPATVTEGGKTISFTYDVNHNRITQTAPEGTTVYTRDPITGSYKDRIAMGDTVVKRNYFPGGVNIATQVGSNPATVTNRYIHGDSLGSSSVLTDPSGAVVERDGFDPWGKRRYANGTSDPNGMITSQIIQGYTGQEQLDDVSLVHMNARLYDPLVGRFISADPTGLRGGANIYAYAGNNPLRNVDPTGTALRIANDGGGEGGDGDSGGDGNGGGGSDGVGGSDGGGDGGGGPPGDRNGPTPGTGSHISGVSDPFVSCYGDCNGLGDRPSSDPRAGSGGGGLGGGGGANARAAVSPSGQSQPDGGPTAGVAPANNGTGVSCTGPGCGVPQLADCQGCFQVAANDRGPRASVPPVLQDAIDSAVDEAVANGGPRYIPPDPDPSTPVGRSGNPMKVPGANSPNTIEGTDYSGHALDQMQGRGVPSSVVQDTINNGIPSPGNTPGTTVYQSPTNNVAVVVNSSGRVITVITKGR